MGTKKIFWLGLFGIAMGFLEATVVIYLRELYYPGGFAFPLPAFPARVLTLEWLREISTIVMLVSIAWVSGENFHKRLAVFLFEFAVWDIFYYVFLKALLGWPMSLLTWDILFLIPVAWLGPVLAPVICSVTMIFMAGLIARAQNRSRGAVISAAEWVFILLGAFVIFISFIYDFSKIIVAGGFLPGILTLATDAEFQKEVSAFVPAKYNWWLFFAGELLILCGLGNFYKRIISAPRARGATLVHG
ncbi:MAG: hypothetical protein ABIH68_03105 [bacterium]